MLSLAAKGSRKLQLVVVVVVSPVNHPLEQVELRRWASGPRHARRRRVRGAGAATHAELPPRHQRRHGLGGRGRSPAKSGAISCMHISL